MTRLVDDIDGSHAVTTLSFGLDGSSYEIDLSESHLSAFRQALAPFITAARAVPNGHPAPAPRREPAPKVRAVPNSDGIAAEATARPTADSQPYRSEPFGSEPFRQHSPSRESAAAQSSSKPGPLVADPFNPRS
ncbi:Lsr2 dimerization domain-containing protein [Pseudonocardia sp. DLS-67]